MDISPVMVFCQLERVAGIEPASTGWKPVIIATIRYPQLIMLPFDKLRALRLLKNIMACTERSDNLINY